MATTSFSNSTLDNPYIPRSLCQIVGFVCLAGFVVHMLALAVPPDVFSLEWRLAVLRQVSDRSIVLLFGVALTFYGSLANRRLLRWSALVSLLIGVFFGLCCILVMRDSLTQQQAAIAAISNQASQIQAQIEQAQSSPSNTLQVTPEQLRQAYQEVKNQTEVLKQNAKLSTIKTGFASVGNFLAAGLGLISLGRYGLRLRG